MEHKRVLINVVIPSKLRDDAKEAAIALDTDLSKVIRQALKELIKKAQKVST
jgi:hypothetical protein